MRKHHVRRALVSGGLSIVLLSSMVPGVALATPVFSDWDAIVAQSEAETEATYQTMASSASSTALRQKADQAKADYEEAKTVASNAAYYKKYGAIAFFYCVGSDAENAYNLLLNADDSVDRYQVAPYYDESSMSMAQMKATVNYLNRINECRRAEGVDPLTGERLGELMVDPYLMAVAMLHGNASAFTYNHMANLGSPYRYSENLAWGYTDPYVGWYTKEKAIWDEAKRTGSVSPAVFKAKSISEVYSIDPDFCMKVGHYLNCVSASHSTFGLSSNQLSRNTWCYEASYSSRDTAMTVSEYTKLFDEYCQLLENSQTKANEAKQYWSDCENAYWASLGYQFTDVKDAGEWYYSPAYNAANLGMFKGTPDGRFIPEGTLSRQDCAVILERYLSVGDSHGFDNKTGLNDVVANEYWTSAANWAVDKGIIKGCDNPDGSRSYNPEGDVTAAQLCTILYRICGTEVDQSVLSKMADAADIQDWAQPACAWAVENGLVQGYRHNDGTYTFAPNESVSRARAATIIIRAIEAGLLSPDALG